MWFTTLRQTVKQKFRWLDSIANIIIISGYVCMAVIIAVNIFKTIINNNELKNIMKNTVLSFSFWKEKIITFITYIIYITMSLFVIMCVWLIFLCMLTTYIYTRTRNDRYLTRQRLRLFFSRLFGRIEPQPDYIRNNQWRNESLMNGHAFQFE